MSLFASSLLIFFRSTFEVAEIKLNYSVNLERHFLILYIFISCNLVTHSDFHNQVQLRRHEKAGKEAKGSGVATQTGSGRGLSPESMNKLKA